MAKKNGKNITVDELAVMMKNSFDSQTKLMLDGFDGVNKKMDKSFQEVNKNFGEVFKILKVMDDKLDDVGSLKHRVDYIETILDLPAIKKH